MVCSQVPKTQREIRQSYVLIFRANGLTYTLLIWLMFAWIENFFFWLPIPFILQAECQNHIRIVAKLSKEVLLVCGTHAYKPKCRHYAFKVSSSAARERRPKTTTTHALESSSRQEFSNCRFLHFAILTKIEAFRTRDGCSCEILKEKRSQSFYVSRNVK